MTLDDLRRALATAGLADLLAHVETLAQPGIALATRATAQDALPVGASSVGGQPDLPAGAAWPSRQGVPLAYVAQIRLEDVAPFDSAHALPARGLLSFFYDAAQETYGGSPADRGGFSVVYITDATQQLERLPFPDALPAEARFTPCAVSFSSILTLPDTPEVALPNLAWSPEQQKSYEAALAGLPGGGGAAASGSRAAQNQLLGYPDTLQDDMRLECQLAAHGVDVSQLETDPRAKELIPGADDWALLLQIDSDGQAGMRWGDGGILYYWIERQALKTADFSNVWCVLQTE
jgi:uncharacterized protein YwqG